MQIVEDALVELMAGSIAALEEDGCVLIGGHTCEGAEPGLGFAVQGTVASGKQLNKGGMTPGDVLVVTKPIGTGVLLAGDMRGSVPGYAVDCALQSMRRSNRSGGSILSRFGATACTDITGFGLIGHLREMCSASKVACDLWLNDIPFLPHAVECVSSGISSTLLPANLRLRRAVQNHNEASSHPSYPLLYDPQTRYSVDLRLLAVAMLATLLL